MAHCKHALPFAVATHSHQVFSSNAAIGSMIKPMFVSASAAAEALLLIALLVAASSAGAGSSPPEASSNSGKCASGDQCVSDDDGGGRGPRLSSASFQGAGSYYPFGFTMDSGKPVRMAITMPVTSRGHSEGRPVSEMRLFTSFLSRDSFSGTVVPASFPLEYNFYIGYDLGDPIFDCESRGPLPRTLPPRLFLSPSRNTGRGTV